MDLEYYYELCDDLSKEKEYKKLLKKISDKTTSREFFNVNNQSNKLHEKRKQLHEKIIKTQIEKYKPQKKPTIHFLLGSIGSGKTSAKDKIIEKDDKRNFLYINFDDLKKQLPEYELLKGLNPKKAAQFVQSESSKIAGSLFKNSIKKGINIIYEKNLRIGANGKLHIIEEIKKVLKKNYTVYLHIVFIDSSKEAWIRVQKRYKKIKRYVPKKDVENSFNSLFPNLNRILNTPCKESYFIKLWYNSILSDGDINKALVIGGIAVNYKISKNKLDKLWDNYMIFFERRENYICYLFSKKRVCLLPKSAIKQLDELDLSKK